MGQISKLAGATAIYGVSSILGRILNYALTPLHTAVFEDTSKMGVVNGLYAYVAILLVIYTFGMETSFFRFSKKVDEESKIYHQTSTVVIFLSCLLSTLIFLNADWLAAAAEYPEAGLYVKWLAIILFIDGLLAIPFAKLRKDNQAKRFATAKVAHIILNVLLQVLFLLVFPAIYRGDFLPSLTPFTQQWFDPELGIGYIFLSNLIANIFLILILFDLLSKIRIAFTKSLLKPILIYSTPIMLMGVAGMINENIAQPMLEKILPENFYPWDAVGVYGQTLKLSIFMMLAIQAFRYAAEPFFFSKAEDKEAPQLFSRIMHYFILFSLAIFVGVSLNVDLIGFIFLRSETYRVALFLVPILLFGKLFYGIYVNLSIWFKLIDETMYGMWFAIVGATVTIIGNVLLIPYIGYIGSAVSLVLCYLVMCSLCYYYGQKKYPIPYNFKKLIPHLIISVIIVFISFQVEWKNFWIDSIFNILITLLLFFVVYIMEFRPLLKRG
ncbi:MAG: lipopolysaccharide biosynthesis protein [Candidatus Cyclobacteriaceae bacterium M2_1C_046]